jgi:hypothetical protein
MFSLSDPTIAVYRRKDSTTSLRIRGFLMVETNMSFGLDAYLRTIGCTLAVQGKAPIEFHTVSFSKDCHFEIGTMVHRFWAAGRTEMDIVDHHVGVLRVDYHLSFTGHPDEQPDYFEVKAPIVRMATGMRRQD